MIFMTDAKADHNESIARCVPSSVLYPVTPIYITYLSNQILLTYADSPTFIPRK